MSGVAFWDCTRMVSERSCYSPFSKAISSLSLGQVKVAMVTYQQTSYSNKT